MTLSSSSLQNGHRMCVWFRSAHSHATARQPVACVVDCYAPHVGSNDLVEPPLSLSRHSRDHGPILYLGSVYNAIRCVSNKFGARRRISAGKGYKSLPHGAPLAEFVHDGLRLVGSSLAGEETCITAPELNLAFESGARSRHLLSVDHVFLTHGPWITPQGLPTTSPSGMFIDNRPGNLYVPRCWSSRCAGFSASGPILTGTSRGERPPVQPGRTCRCGAT